jgi:hypothetical protein
VAQENYESLNLKPAPIRPHILAAATIVLGDDYYSGRRETVNLSGFVQLNKWPMEGFKHRVDDRGYAEFETELISAPEVGIKGYSYELDDRIQVLSNQHLPNAGFVRQITPGANFPAHFNIRRFGILESSSMRLAHRNVIDINGVVDTVPPFKKPLTGPYAGVPRGDGPFDLIPAVNVVRGTTLPEAWYPSNDMNQPQGIVPSMFFAPSAAACMSMLVDPTLILQSSMQGTVTLELSGKTVTVELAGDRKLAAGAEFLLFAPDKHGDGNGIQAQLARVAMVGECAELGGRVMLRVSWPKPSGGVFGDGTEQSLSMVKLPGELHIDAEFELVTPTGALYTDSPLHISTNLDVLEPGGQTLVSDGPGSAMVEADGTFRGHLNAVTLKMGDSVVGEHSMMNA